MTTPKQVNTLELTGLDGSNPLAFLAALGTLRSLSMMYPESEFRLGWQIDSGAWRPFIESEVLELDASSLCDDLSEWLADPPQLPLFESIGDNLTLSPKAFASLARSSVECSITDPKDISSQSALEFLIAFGSDATHQPHSKDRTQMQDTALRTMSGAGHQHFIQFMRHIIANTDSSQLQSTLFAFWRYEDEGRGANLRWDPIDDRRYAMRWKNPSADAAKSMRGANRLAIEAIPFFVTAPMKNRLETTGFRSRKGAFWFWPIWEDAIDVRSIMSLLQLAVVSAPSLDESLSKRGIKAVYRSQRITIGKFRNFTPAQPVCSA